MRLFSNKWLIRAHDERAERELVASLGLRPLTARLLTARGLTEPAAVSSFIKKTDLRFYDPFLLTDMDKAVSRIEQAIRTGERICIYGDYDVDGVTSTTVLYTYLTSRGARCTYFIPDRLSERPSNGLRPTSTSSSPSIPASPPRRRPRSPLRSAWI